MKHATPQRLLVAKETMKSAYAPPPWEIIAVAGMASAKTVCRHVGRNESGVKCGVKCVWHCAPQNWSTSPTVIRWQGAFVAQRSLVISVARRSLTCSSSPAMVPVWYPTVDDTTGDSSSV